MPIIIKTSDDSWIELEPEGDIPVLFVTDFDFQRLTDGEIDVNDLQCSEFRLQDALCDFIVDEPEFPEYLPDEEEFFDDEEEDYFGDLD